jgi:hypothetical protein
MYPECIIRSGQTRAPLKVSVYRQGMKKLWRRIFTYRLVKDKDDDYEFFIPGGMLRRLLRFIFECFAIRKSSASSS